MTTVPLNSYDEIPQNIAGGPIYVIRRYQIREDNLAQLYPAAVDVA